MWNISNYTLDRPLVWRGNFAPRFCLTAEHYGMSGLPGVRVKLSLPAASHRMRIRA